MVSNVTFGEKMVLQIINKKMADVRKYVLHSF